VGLAAIYGLDLTRIRRKLQEPAPEGKGWDEKTALEAEKWYRRFLEVCLRNPKFPVVPNPIIDAFWHQHILDTRAYERDCNAIFGAFMHHYPYFGLNGDAAERDRAFARTNGMYRTLFGEDCTSMASGCNTPCEGEVTGHGIKTVTASGCNHSGSGTGCGQGGRGHRGLPHERFVDKVPDHPVGCQPQYADFGRPYPTFH